MTVVWEYELNVPTDPRNACAIAPVIAIVPSGAPQSVVVDHVRVVERRSDALIAGLLMTPVVGSSGELL